MADFQDRILAANELGLAPAARGAPPYFCRWYCVTREVTAGNLIFPCFLPPRRVRAGLRRQPASRVSAVRFPGL